jgi:hypothetical protein
METAWSSWEKLAATKKSVATSTAVLSDGSTVVGGFAGVVESWLPRVPMITATATTTIAAAAANAPIFLFLFALR